MIGDAFSLGLRHLASAPGRTVVLVLGAAIAMFLPLFTGLAADQLEEALLARAQATPLIIGHKGSPLQLTLSSLYFQGIVEDTVPYSTARHVEEMDYGEAVPLYVAHSSSGAPLVGTGQGYFARRGLTAAQGRLPALLGEVVAGSAVAESFNLSVGDTIRSDLRNLYNLAGSYPMLLEVVGILRRSGTPDDRAFFADVKTTWALDGWLHGHEAVTEQTALNPGADAQEALEATAAIFMLTEITDQTRASFHFHGDIDDLPLSAVLVFPDTPRQHDQLLGDYALHELDQATRPPKVIDAILSVVLQVREGLAVYFAAVALSTLAFFSLVISLTLQLRRRELTLMERIGCSPMTIPAVVGAEILLIVMAAALLSIALTGAGQWLLQRSLL